MPETLLDTSGLLFKQLEKMEKHGILEKPRSEWASFSVGRMEECACA